MADNKDIGSGDKYFATFGGYDLPLRLQDPISKSEAERSGTYYVARFGEGGRLADVRKVMGGKTFFRHEYDYDSDGVLQQARITNTEGVTKVLTRTADGTLREK